MVRVSVDRWFSLAVSLPLLVGLPACAKVQARTPAEVLTLDMPAPPSRVTVPVTLVVPEEPPPPAPPAPAPAPPRARDTSPRPAPPPAPAAAPAQPESSPVLQTTANVNSVAQETAALLAQAERDLGQLNYRDLTSQARAQYDSAMGFVRQAKQALDIKNYMFAQQLAVKAAAVASALVRG
jgi:hypothetical protein